MDNKDKVALTPEEAEWFEKNKNLPFYSTDVGFVDELYRRSWSWGNQDGDERAIYMNRLTKAYFVGYVVKEKKYYIKLNFNDYDASYLRIDDDGWFWDNPTDFGDYPTQFTQAKINEMQKNPQARGLDLNVLKVEVPEDELVK